MQLEVFQDPVDVVLRVLVLSEQRERGHFCKLTAKKLQGLKKNGMPQKERLRVWRGELKKTAGGLTKADLVKNKRGGLCPRRRAWVRKRKTT